MDPHYPVNYVEKEELATLLECALEGVRNSRTREVMITASVLVTLNGLAHIRGSSSTAFQADVLTRKFLGLT